MARADLLLLLVEAALSGDESRVRRTVEAMSADEAEKRHTVLAKQLDGLLETARPMTMAADSRNRRMLLEVHPKRRLADLALPDVVRSELAILVSEQHRAELLRAFNIEPRNRVLLVGPPGNGKTSCAEAIAAELSVPLVPLRYETIITSYLGETSANLGRVLDEVKRRHCVLFLDEFDTVAKERGDRHDSGEIKRIVSTLLLQLDDLPSHVVLCAATNHSELLDRATWRRFQLRLELSAPGRDQRVAFGKSLQERLALSMGKSVRTIVDKLGPASYSEIEEFFVELKRRQILASDIDGERPELLDDLLYAWRHRAEGPKQEEP